MLTHSWLVVYPAQMQRASVYFFPAQGSALPSFHLLRLSPSGRSSSSSPDVPFPPLVAHHFRRHPGAACPCDAERAKAVHGKPQKDQEMSNPTFLIGIYHLPRAWEPRGIFLVLPQSSSSAVHLPIFASSEMAVSPETSSGKVGMRSVVCVFEATCGTRPEQQ